MIEYASKSDISAIVRLWSESFGDAEDYIKFFADRHSAPCLLYKSGGEAASMLYLLGGSVRIGGSEYSAKYIYAACTAAKHRGKGYMGELIRFALAGSAQAGDGFVCLVPGEKSLFDYYDSLGFITAFRKRIFTADTDKLKALTAGVPVKSGEPDFEKLSALRNSLCGDAFLWDAEALGYAFAENELCSGSSLCLPDNSGYALLRGDTITEAFALPESMNSLIALICAESDSGLSEIRAFNALPAFEPVQTVDNAMLYPLSSAAKAAASKINDAYFGLTLE